MQANGEISAKKPVTKTSVKKSPRKVELVFNSENIRKWITSIALITLTCFFVFNMFFRSRASDLRWAFNMGVKLTKIANEDDLKNVGKDAAQKRDIEVLLIFQNEVNKRNGKKTKVIESWEIDTYGLKSEDITSN